MFAVLNIRKYARKPWAVGQEKKSELDGSKPTSQSRIYMPKKDRGRHAVRGGIDPGDYRYSSRVVGAVNIRRMSEPGMRLFLPRVRRNCPPLVGEP